MFFGDAANHVKYPTTAFLAKCECNDKWHLVLNGFVGKEEMRSVLDSK
jgi:hypothetical protein